MKTSRSSHALFASVVGVLIAMLPSTGSAHRVDEYLQAARISIGPDRVDLDLDLTPGMTVARQVFDWIDRDADGIVSAAERIDYAQAVVDAITLQVDGRPLPLRLTDAQVPGFADMADGIGTIRVNATTANAMPASSGRHQLVFRNTYRPEMSVYLVNALVPSSTGVTITGQYRDRLQRETRIDYRIAPELWRRLGGSTLLPGVLIATLLMTMAAIWRHRWTAVSAPRQT